MEVYVPRSHNRKHFHASPECRGLKTTTAVPVDILEAKAKPCLLCFPDAPQTPLVHKAYCQICSTRRACPHNGGIRISEKQPHRWSFRWVWPDSKMVLAKRLSPVVE